MAEEGKPKDEGSTKKEDILKAVAEAATMDELNSVERSHDLGAEVEKEINDAINAKGGELASKDSGKKKETKKPAVMTVNRGLMKKKRSNKKK